MVQQTVEVTKEIVNFIFGNSDLVPENILDFLALRVKKEELAIALKFNHEQKCKGFSNANKEKWLSLFISLEGKKRKQIVIKHPKVIPLFPRDLKQLLITQKLNSIGKRSFNPGKQVTFDIYSIADAVKVI